MGKMPAMAMNDCVFEAVISAGWTTRVSGGHTKLARVCRAKFACIIHSLLTSPHTYAKTRAAFGNYLYAAMALRPATMAGLSRRVMASQVMAPVRSGGGGPIALGKPAAQPVCSFRRFLWTYLTSHTQNPIRNNVLRHQLIPLIQLTEEDELRWDDGTAHPEYCLDQFNLVGRVSCNVAQTLVS